MSDYFPFHQQTPVGYIAPEQVEGFSLERFRFAQDALMKATAATLPEGRHIDKVVDASLKLIEATVGTPKYARGTRWMHTGTGDEVIW